MYGGGRSNVCYEFRDYGTCRFGDSCRFDHDGGKGGDSGGASGGGSGAYGGSYGGSGGGGGGGGGYGYGRSGSSFRSGGNECFQWRDTGSCRFGTSCRFDHVGASKDVDGGYSGGGGGAYGGGGGGYGRSSSYGRGYGGGGGGGGGNICYNWRDSGTCRFGSSCRFDHVGGGASGGGDERGGGKDAYDTGATGSYDKGGYDKSATGGGDDYEKDYAKDS